MESLEKKVLLLEQDPVGSFDSHQLLIDHYKNYENKTVSK